MKNDTESEYKKKLFDLFKSKDTNTITVESLKYRLYQAEIKGVSEKTIEVFAYTGYGPAIKRPKLHEY
jgi:hypothetical protein